MKKTGFWIVSALVGLGLSGGYAFGEGGQKPPRRLDWAFDGVFGRVDKPAAQRGFQVYKEVCSACHSLNRIAFHNLDEPGGPGFTEAQAKAIAAGYKIPAEPNDKGELFDS